MLLEILMYIKEKDDFSTKGIANSLNVSEYIVDKYKEKLISLDYIHKVDDSCNLESCKKCGCGCSGKKLNQAISWEITKKGVEVLNKINK